MAATVGNERSRLPGWIEAPIRVCLERVAVSGKVSFEARPRISLGAGISSYHGLDVGIGFSLGQRSLIEVNGSIGNFVLIGRGVQIVGRADHAIDEVGVPVSLSTWVGQRAPMRFDRIIIGDDVWVGAGAVILGGVEIGMGSVVAAGAIVTKSCPPNSIIGGNPARLIRPRFSESDFEKHMQNIKQLVKNYNND